MKITIPELSPDGRRTVRVKISAQGRASAELSLTVLYIVK